MKWINRQRVLVFATRGIGHRHRHLMDDVKKLMPHHRPESKMERSKNLQVINEMCKVKNCNKSILFEGRKKRDLYMWLADVPNGPSAKFLLENSTYPFDNEIDTRAMQRFFSIYSLHNGRIKNGRQLFERITTIIIV